VETGDPVTRIFKHAPHFILETSRFGRSESMVYWLDSKNLLETSRLLKDGGFDWLENLSAMQVDENLVFTYFLRGSQGTDTAVFRTSIELGSVSGKSGFGEDWVEMDSVASVWPMAQAFESEISRLFGVKLRGVESRFDHDGFPLRKTFVVNGGIQP
jgi:NADH:ubiquinone oxidoreductase subunit C